MYSHTHRPSASHRLQEEIQEAMKLIWSRGKLVCEPSGAVPLAAYRSKSFRSLYAKNGTTTMPKTALVVSGGNLDLTEVWQPLLASM